MNWVKPNRYSSPKVTIWPAEALDEIEADMSYGGGCFYSCYSGCSYSGCSYTGCTSYEVCSYGSCSYSGGAAEAGSKWQDAFLADQDANYSGTAAMRWYKFDSKGVVDLECNASSAYLTLYKTYNNAPTDKDAMAADSMSKRLVHSGSISHFLCIASKNGKPVSHTFAYSTHTDYCTEYYDTGATWKRTSGQRDIDILPSEVIYLPEGGVQTLIELIRNDASLQFIQNVYDAGSYLSEVIAEYAIGYSLPIAFVSILAYGFFNLNYHDTAQSLTEEILTNESLYANGIRAYRYVNVYQVEYTFEPWNGYSTMRAAAGSLGQWAPNS